MTTGAVLDSRTQIRRPVRAGLWVMVLTFVVFGGWATLAPLSGAVIALGVVKVDNNRKTVQHLEGGIVAEILIKDGDHVEAGQPLIVIQSEQVSATVDTLGGQLDAELAKAARLRAERDFVANIAFPASLAHRSSDPAIAETLQVERQLFETKRQALAAQMSLLETETGQVSEEVAALRHQVGARDRALKLLSKEIDANETLSRQKLVEEVRILALKRSYEEYEAQRGEHLAEIAKAQQRGTELRIKMITLKDQYIQQAATDLTTTQSKIFDLQERVRPSQDALKRQRIEAPIAGTVVGLKVFTIGGIIAPREPLLDIVPDHNPLIVEAQVKVEDIDNLKPGLTVDVRLTAYSQRNTPILTGRVTYVSADRMVDQETNTPFYTAHIVIDDASLAAAAKDIVLFPGMPAEVFVNTGARTALDYFLEPLTSTLRRSLREP